MRELRSMTSNQHYLPKQDKEIESQFLDCLRRLHNHCIAFDNGNEEIAADIASCVHMIVFRDGNSKSKMGFLSLLNKRDRISFLDTNYKFYKNNVMPHIPFADLTVSVVDGKKYLYYSTTKAVKENDPDIMNWTTFNEWWSGIILRRWDDLIITRGDLITFFRNQIGSHASNAYTSINSLTAKQLQELSQGDLSRWEIIDGEDRLRPVRGPEYATVRQIAWELVVSIKRSLPTYFSDGLNPLPAARMKPTPRPRL